MVYRIVRRNWRRGISVADPGPFPRTVLPDPIRLSQPPFFAEDQYNVSQSDMESQRHDFQIDVTGRAYDPAKQPDVWQFHQQRQARSVHYGTKADTFSRTRKNSPADHLVEVRTIGLRMVNWSGVCPAGQIVIAIPANSDRRRLVISNAGSVNAPNESIIVMGFGASPPAGTVLLGGIMGGIPLSPAFSQAAGGINYSNSSTYEEYGVDCSTDEIWVGSPTGSTFIYTAYEGLEAEHQNKA